MDALREKVDKLPSSPGVYIMKDKEGVVIYVGKAINLRARVRTYFNGGDGRLHVRYLMAEVADVEFSLAQTEREALILEDTLIKKFKPRFNIRLRDDKTYLSLRLDLKQEFPRIELMRRPRQDGARYFGPYSSASHIRQTVDFISRYFPLRTCEDSELRGRERPCLQYQIKRCSGPCVGLIDKPEYHALVEQVVMILEGRDDDLLKSLKQQMMAAAEEMQFEKAAQLRDRLKALQAVGEQQQVVSQTRIDRDIIGFHREADEVVFSLIPVRVGRMQDHRTFYFSAQAGEDTELLASFVNQLYPEGDFVPREVLLPFDMEDRPVLEDILRERAGHKVALLVPQRGDKTRLIDLAAQTARAALAQELDQTRRAERAAVELQKVLRLEHPPRSLECFDISNTQGKRPVASKVRFQDAKPFKDGYRRYRIKTLEESPNDYGMMREVLTRRVRRGIDEGGMPDLLVVDGGKGQLNVAVAVLQELGLESQPVIGFAKPDSPDARSRTPISIDKIFLPGRKNPIVLPAHSPALRMLQAMRDESHRFAITYHRSLRSKSTIRSALEDVPGVGEKRRKLLLKHFGSLKRIKEATQLELAELEGIGPSLAAQILMHLHGIGGKNKTESPSLRDDESPPNALEALEDQELDDTLDDSLDDDEEDEDSLEV
ncbi:MAG: excinuclease ABC subunit UvrC [Myxococcota bacterium]